MVDDLHDCLAAHGIARFDLVVDHVIDLFLKSRIRRNAFHACRFAVKAVSPGRDRSFRCQDPQFLYLARDLSLRSLLFRIINRLFDDVEDRELDGISDVFKEIVRGITWDHDEAAACRFQHLRVLHHGVHRRFRAFSQDESGPVRDRGMIGNQHIDMFLIFGGVRHFDDHFHEINGGQRSYTAQHAYCVLHSPSPAFCCRPQAALHPLLPPASSRNASGCTSLI